MSASEDPRVTLWAAVLALMNKRYKRERLGHFAEQAELGAATLTRLKQQKTSIGLEVLEKIARFAGLAPWQLLVPGFDVESPPALRTGREWPLELVDQSRYERLTPEQRGFVQAAMTREIEEFERAVPAVSPQNPPPPKVPGKDGKGSLGHMSEVEAKGIKEHVKRRSAPAKKGATRRK